MKRAVVYVRISDDRAGSGLGVARQEKECRALCEREGWPVVAVLSDNDRSAYSGKRRAGYEALLDGLRSRSYDVVVAWHPDRLHRSPKELEEFIDIIEKAKARVGTVTAGHYDLSTPSGRAIARTLGTWARFESEHKAERARSKHRELAEAGAVSGGGRCFGYRDDHLTVDPVEGALVRDAARAVLDGASLRSIVAQWNAAGVRTTLGNEWQSVVLKRLLTAPRVAGYREHGGKLHPAQWPALVDDFTWRRLRAVLLDPARRKGGAPRAYLLTGGLAVCGLCGARLIARPKADGRRCYVCASPPNFDGCGKIRVLADDFERDVSARVLAVIAEGRIPGEATPDVAALLLELDTVEDRAAELADDYYSPHRSISKAQFQSASTMLAKEAERLSAEVAASERVSRGPAIDLSVLDRWDSPETTLEDRRSVIERMIDRVVVGPAVKGRNYYDAARVTIPDDAWRV